MIQQLTGDSGVYQTAIDGLWVSRISTPDLPRHTIEFPVLCVVAQGALSILLPGGSFTHGPDQYLVMGLQGPVIAQLIDVSPERPYLGATLALDFQELSELALLQEHHSEPAGEPGLGTFLGNFNHLLADAFCRLIALLATPNDIPALAPLIRREIFYRVLNNGQSSFLRTLIHKKSQVWRIARTVDWMKAHYAEPLKVEQLARSAHMSLAGFHAWFKKVTALSPLQFQKRLRLQEARRMLYRDGIDATRASQMVGYESPSHFNRDYSRLFGAPPLRDIERMHRVSGGVNGQPRVLIPSGGPGTLATAPLLPATHGKNRASV